jgi:hypothetical protein
VFGREIVPADVIVPPFRPAPAVTLVTVPRPVAEIVTAPVVPDRMILLPALRLVTPELEIVTLPVLALTLIPAPENTPLTDPPPPEESTPSALTESPEPST